MLLVRACSFANGRRESFLIAFGFCLTVVADDQFCYACLLRSYGSNAATMKSEEVDSWLCPACTNTCICAACGRRQQQQQVQQVMQQAQQAVQASNSMPMSRAGMNLNINGTSNGGGNSMMSSPTNSGGSSLDADSPTHATTTTKQGGALLSQASAGMLLRQMAPPSKPGSGGQGGMTMSLSLQQAQAAAAAAAMNGGWGMPMQMGMNGMGGINGLMPGALNGGGMHAGMNGSMNPGLNSGLNSGMNGAMSGGMQSLNAPGSWGSLPQMVVPPPSSVMSMGAQGHFGGRALSAHAAPLSTHPGAASGYNGPGTQQLLFNNMGLNMLSLQQQQAQQAQQMQQQQMQMGLMNDHTQQQQLHQQQQQQHRSGSMSLGLATNPLALALPMQPSFGVRGSGGPGLAAEGRLASAPAALATAPSGLPPPHLHPSTVAAAFAFAGAPPSALSSQQAGGPHKYQKNSHPASRATTDPGAHFAPAVAPAAMAEYSVAGHSTVAAAAPPHTDDDADPLAFLAAAAASSVALLPATAPLVPSFSSPASVASMTASAAASSPSTLSPASVLGFSPFLPRDRLSVSTLLSSNDSSPLDTPGMPPSAQGSTATTVTSTPVGPGGFVMQATQQQQQAMMDASAFNSGGGGGAQSFPLMYFQHAQQQQQQPQTQLQAWTQQQQQSQQHAHQLQSPSLTSPRQLASATVPSAGGVVHPQPSTLHSPASMSPLSLAAKSAMGGSGGVVIPTALRRMPITQVQQSQPSLMQQHPPQQQLPHLQQPQQM